MGLEQKPFFSLSVRERGYLAPTCRSSEFALPQLRLKVSELSDEWAKAPGVSCCVLMNMQILHLLLMTLHHVT